LASQNPEAPALALESATAVRETVARLIADLYAGKLHPRVATGLGPLLHLQLRAIEKTDVEGRIAEIEQQLRKLQSTLEKTERQRMVPERAKRLADPEEPEAIKGVEGL
jgi:hypothetical protein